MVKRKMSQAKHSLAWRAKTKVCSGQKVHLWPKLQQKMPAVWVKNSGSWDLLQTNWIRTSGKKDCHRLPAKLTPFQGLPLWHLILSSFLSFFHCPHPMHLLAGSPWKWHCGHSNLKHITTQMPQIHETKVIRISEFCHIAISMTKMQNQLHFSTFGMNDLYKKMTDPFTAAWQREFGSKFNKNQDLTLKTTVMEKNLRHE